MSDEVGLVRIVAWNRAVQVAGIQQWQAETAGIEGECFCEAGNRMRSRSPGDRLLGTATGERYDWIRNAIVHAVEDAAHGARVIDNAIRLSALNDGQPGNRPPVGQHALE